MIKSYKFKNVFTSLNKRVWWFDFNENYFLSLLVPCVILYWKRKFGIDTHIWGITADATPHIRVNHLMLILRAVTWPPCQNLLAVATTVAKYNLTKYIFVKCHLRRIIVFFFCKAQNNYLAAQFNNKLMCLFTRWTPTTTIYMYEDLTRCVIYRII